MSVILTGNKFPTNCLGCEFCADSEGYVHCQMTEKKVGTTVGLYERMKDCPLKSIEGLIDKISKYLYENEFGSEYRSDIADLIKEYCRME